MKELEALRPDQAAFVYFSFFHFFFKSKYRGGMGKEMGGRFKRAGMYVYLWLIHIEV